VLKWLAAAAATGVVLPLALVLLVTANPATSVAGTSTADGPSVLALTDIPPTYLAWYMGAARTCPACHGACWPGSARSKVTTVSPQLPEFAQA
jgi:hypothetical protein